MPFEYEKTQDNQLKITSTNEVTVSLSLLLQKESMILAQIENITKNHQMQLIKVREQIQKAQDLGIT